MAEEYKDNTTEETYSIIRGDNGKHVLRSMNPKSDPKIPSNIVVTDNELASNYTIVTGGGGRRKRRNSTKKSKRKRGRKSYRRRR